jgi:hypothetical protein
MMRFPWIFLAVLLGAGVPFWAFGVSSLPFVPALLISIAGLAAAGWAVRRGAQASQG